jgi:hypothetical protein
MLQLTVSHPVCESQDQIFITVRQLLVRWCWASSLTMMDLSFTIAAGLHQCSHSQGWVLQDSWVYFYCLWVETSPTWKTRSPYLYPPGTGWPSYILRHWVPFLSPATTRRATVEAFEPASPCTPLSNQSQSYFTTDHQSIHRGIKSLETHDQIFFFPWTLAVIIPM